MKKKFTFLMAVLLLMTFLQTPIGMLGQSKTETTTTYTFTSKSWAATSGGNAANWTSGQDGAGFSNNGIQVTTAATGANGTSPVSFTNVTKIVATYNTNKSKGAGTIAAQIGSNTAVSKNWAYSSGDGTSANYTVQWDYNTPQTGNVKITCNTTTNSIYLVSVAITTTSGGGSSATATTTAINASGITNTNVYSGTVAGTLSASVTYDNSGTPAAVPEASVTWSGDDDDVATIDEDTGEVTLVGAGTVTFTATYAGNDDYSTSSDTYEMTVINEDPSLVTIWSENFSSYSADDVPNGGTYGYACTNGGGTTKIYTENSAGGESPELLVAKSSGTFSATVPLERCYSGNLTLTFKSNANNITVKSGTSGITVDGEASVGAGVTFNTLGTHTVTFKGTTTSSENIIIIFTAGSKNVRLDDIVLKGLQTKVSTPTISPAGGSVVSGTEVTMTCATYDATIHYTTDGTTPTSSSTTYNPAIKPTITSACTIKAIGIKYGLDESEVVSATYTIADPCATPTFSVPAGEVDKGTSVTISTETTDATIYYTTNGTDPTTSSTTYSSAITINSAMTIKAIAVKTGNANSEVATAAYTIRDYATLPFVYDGGNELTTGLTGNGLGSDYSTSPKLKIDATGDYVILKLNAAPTSLSYSLKSNGTFGSNSVFKVQISADGETYEDLVSYTTMSTTTQTFTHINLASTVRYIKWVYTNKDSGNVGLGNIHASTNYEIYGNTTVATLTIPATKTCTIYSGITLNVTTTLTNNGTAANLIIEDGGQLIVSNDDVAATFKKSIDAPSSKTDVYGWYTISSPVHDDGEETTIDVENVTNLVLNTDPSFKYDMFAYDEVNQKWLNRKESTVSGHESDGFDIMNKGQGYIYRNSGEDIEFVGIVNYGDYTINDLTYTGVGDLAGFHLFGNPYSHNIKLTNTTLLDENGDQLASQLSGCYILRDDSWGAEITTGDIAPNQGFLVKISSSAKKIKFSETKRGVNYHSDNIKFMVANNQHEDVAYALFKDAIGLNKINHRNPEVPMLYINQNGEDFAIASMSDDTKAFNLNFKAGTMGKYTLSYKADGVFQYLHIYDRLTNTDVDMLLEGEYSFIATPNDNENRFIVMLGYMPDYSEGNDDVFAYQSGNEVLVSGTGELQIFDVTGRKVMTTTINGAESISVTAPGIYIFRLVGTEVKTQKIVVR